jgi:hypothetical protein
MLGSGVLVQRGLRPLEELATVAEGITARRLDQRMALRAPPREVGRLAGTLRCALVLPPDVRLSLLPRQRLGEVIALGQVTAQRLHLVGLLGRLHAFRDHREPKGMT